MNRVRHTVERFRQPEYTGRNRCLPCTAVNAALAVALAAAVGAGWRPVGGLLVLGISVAAIYLRGYLVPGTPELTQRYFPDRVVRAFDKNAAAQDAARERAVDAGDVDATETEKLLTSTGVVEPCAEEDDLCLTDQFSDVWWRRIRQFRADDERAADHLATVMDVDPTALSFVDGDQFGVVYEGKLIAEWASDAAFYADLAAEPTLAEWLGDRDGLDDRQRTELLVGLRGFLQECPACEADLEQVEEVRKFCCTGDVVSVSVDCGSCGARVFGGSYR